MKQSAQTSKQRIKKWVRNATNGMVVMAEWQMQTNGQTPIIIA